MVICCGFVRCICSVFLSGVIGQLCDRVVVGPFISVQLYSTGLPLSFWVTSYRISIISGMHKE